MPDYDKKPEPAAMQDEVVIKHYANGATETIQTKTIGTDPSSGNPTTFTNIYQESDDWCLNPWDKHPPFRVTKQVNGDVTEKGTLLCYDCLKENDKLIKRKAWWRIPFINDPKTY